MSGEKEIIGRLNGIQKTYEDNVLNDYYFKGPLYQHQLAIELNEERNVLIDRLKEIREEAACKES